MGIILPIHIAGNVKDLLDDLVRNRAFVTQPIITAEGLSVKVVSKMLRSVTRYPTGGVPESWVISVNPVFGRRLYSVRSVFYGDNRLATGLTMYDIPFTYDTDRVLTADDAYRFANRGTGEFPFNITVVHDNRVSTVKYSPNRMNHSITGEWAVIQHTYSPRQLTELDLRQVELAHRIIERIHQIGNPTIGLGDLYIVDSSTFKQRVRTLGTFGGEIENLARDIIKEFEVLEEELKKPSIG